MYQLSLALSITLSLLCEICFFQFHSNILILRTHIEVEARLGLYWYSNIFDYYEIKNVIIMSICDDHKCMYIPQIMLVAQQYDSTNFWILFWLFH